MILATHAIAGAALASMMPDRPGLAFIAGVISHFLLDTIPHWDYQLRSKREDKSNPLDNDIIIGHDFWFDLIKISGDALLGLILSWLFFYQTFTGELGVTTFVAGAIGGLLPDAFQIAYFKLRSPWLTILQRFHYWIHADREKKLEPIIGVISQAFLIALIVSTVKFIL